MAYLTPDETRQMAMNAARLCAERDWSQAELARASGLSVSTLRKMRRTRHSSQDGTLRSLAAAFSLSDAEELLRPWEPSEADAPAQPGRLSGVRSSQAAFNQQVEELRRVAARVARTDPQAASRLYTLLIGRVRQMTQAIQAETRGRNR